MKSISFRIKGRVILLFGTPAELEVTARKTPRGTWALYLDT
jgi:hypothetical protein